jgi:ABC-type glycerol-3-phosphate transport system substrate-binding protein
MRLEVERTGGCPPRRKGGAAMRRSRFVVLLAVGAMIAAACTGGGSDGGETGGKVTLDYWVFESGGLVGSFLDELQKEFEAKNPNVTLNITAYPEDNYGVKLDTAIAAGKEPDLVLVFGPEQMRQGLLLPLDDMIKEHNIDLSTFVPSIVEPGDEFSCNYQGTLYCLGSYAGSVQLIYNKDMFEAAGVEPPPAWPPITPEQFVEDACKLTDKAKGVWGAAASDPLAYSPWETFFSDDGKTAELNAPESVQQFQILASGYDRGCFPTSNILDPWEQGRDFFAQGKLAMVVTDFQDLDKLEKAGINYGTSAVPTPSGETPFWSVWTDSVGVMASTDHPDEAKDFIAFLATRGQELRADISGDMPLDLEVAEDGDWAHGVPGREDGIEVLSHARPAVFIPNRWDVMGPFWDAWGLVVGGEKSVQAALNDADQAVQENLDQAWEDWEEGA